jgi:L-iditol 2-dehydrogenase
VAVFTGPGAIELRDEEIPRPGKGEVLVRVGASAVCTMEQRLYRGLQTAYPIIPGHETAGVVEELGPEVVLDVKPGDRVAVAFLGRCGQCFHCRVGQSELCTGRRRGRQPGQLFRIGGFGEYVVVGAEKLYPIGPTLPLEQAALCEPIACVTHSVNRAQLRLGDDVAVIGGGTMGHLHLLIARLRGARVFVIEPDPAKAALARAHGAADVVDPSLEETVEAIKRLTGGRGADVVFVTVGTKVTAAQGYRAARDGGRVMYYGAYYPSISIEIEPDYVHHHQVVLDGAISQNVEDWQQASRMLASGILDVSHVVSARYPLGEIDTAMQRAVKAAEFRIVMTMP